MKKTNIRINNLFVIMDRKSNTIDYYQSDIDKTDIWGELHDKELKKYKNNKVTGQVTSLIDENNIKSNVNFILLSDNYPDKSPSKNIIVTKVGG